MRKDTDWALDAVEIETGPDPQHTVLWLHGLGADGHDFASLVPALDLRGRSVRFVFPHAPVRAVTMNGGYRMRAWYDVFGLGRLSHQDEAGIRAAAQAVQAWIVSESQRIGSSGNLVLAGFSQGAALALYVGLRSAVPLAGILALSSYMPLAASLAAELSPAGREVPVLMTHGTFDPVLTLGLGEESRDGMLRAGCTVEWRTYPMAHELCAAEIHDIGAWLDRVWSANADRRVES